MKQCSVVAYFFKRRSPQESKHVGGEAADSGQGVVTFKQMRDVVAYKEDVHGCITIQTDDILRYETYVIGENDAASPQLWPLVDDGILPWNFALLGDHLTQRLRSAQFAKQKPLGYSPARGAHFKQD